MNGFLMQAEVYFRKQIRIKQKIYELFTIIRHLKGVFFIT